MGCTLRVAYLDRFPFITKAQENTSLLNVHERRVFRSGNMTMYGGNINQIQILKLLSYDLNFTISWVRAEDNSYGVYNAKTKEWDGLIGLIVKDMADLSSAHLTVTSLRSSAVDFTAEFDNTKFGLFMKKPKLSSSWGTFLEVFYLTYWICLIAIVLACSLILAMFFVILNNNNASKEKSGNNKQHFVDKVGISTAMVCLSLATHDVFVSKNLVSHATTALKILIFVVCLFGALNNYAYNAGLISSLINHDYAPEINSLEDLVTKSGHQLVLREGTASVNYFRNAVGWPHNQIWEKLLDKNSDAYAKNVNEAEQIILNKERQVYFDITSHIEPSFDNYPCNIIRSPKTYFHRPVALALQKRSPYLKLISYKLRKYIEFGVIGNMDAIKRSPLVICPNNEFEEIGYKTIFSAFIVFGVGLVLAVIYCIIEYYYFWKCHKHNRAHPFTNQVRLGEPENNIIELGDDILHQANEVWVRAVMDITGSSSLPNDMMRFISQNNQNIVDGVNRKLASPTAHNMQ